MALLRERQIGICKGEKSKMQTSESFRFGAILSFSGGLQQLSIQSNDVINLCPPRKSLIDPLGVQECLRARFFLRDAAIPEVHITHRHHPLRISGTDIFPGMERQYDIFSKKHAVCAERHAEKSKTSRV